ncbi:MAG: hypothetical protein M3Q81_03405, partial [bacterium]|nr:hypothetical protein [bacterium]
MPEIFDSSDQTARLAADPDETRSSKTQKIRDVDSYSMVMRQEKSGGNIFAAFLPKPTNVFFDSQHHEEKVLLLLRRHPITQVPWILGTIIALFVPFLFNSVGLFSFMPLNYQVATLIGWYVLLIGFVIESFLTWFFNVYIITDERIIDVDFINLIQKNVSAAKLDMIEDISAKTGGV